MKNQNVILLWYCVSVIICLAYNIHLPMWMWAWPVLAYVFGYAITKFLIMLDKLLS